MKSIPLRTFLPKLAGALLMVSLGVAAAMAADVRSYVAGNFFFNLDGVKSGFVKSVDGGAITAEVIEEPGGPGLFVKKHIGTPKYEEFSLQIGFSMSKVVYDWIAASWQMNIQRKNGSIITADFNLEARSERQFFNALITEVGIPACDGASKEPAFLTLKFAPELTRVVKASGKVAANLGMKQQALWLPSNFRLTIDGLDASRVSKIDSFTVKQRFVTDPIGDARDYLKEPGKLEFPNLKITFSESSAQSWLQWHEDFVIRGNAGDDKERNGMLELLAPDRQTVLARIRFFNMGILSVEPARPASDPCQIGCPADFAAVRDAIGKMQAELYVERMEFEALSFAP